MNTTMTRSGSRSDRGEHQNGSQETYAIKPLYRIQENEDAWGVTVQLPGVTKDTVEISAEQGQLVIRGKRSWQVPEGWTALHRESVDATYELVLTHDNLVNTDKIHAELKDGILRVSLPKAEALKPRKISIG